MRVIAIAPGEYGNVIIEKGQVFDLVPRTGKKQVHIKDANGMIVDIKYEKRLITPEQQFAASWMKKVGVSTKKTVATQRIGTELVVSNKVAIDKTITLKDGKRIDTRELEDLSDDSEFEDSEVIDTDSEVNSEGVDSDLTNPPPPQGGESGGDVL